MNDDIGVERVIVQLKWEGSTTKLGWKMMVEFITAHEDSRHTRIKDCIGIQWDGVQHKITELMSPYSPISAYISEHGFQNIPLLKFSNPYSELYADKNEICTCIFHCCIPKRWILFYCFSWRKLAAISMQCEHVSRSISTQGLEVKLYCNMRCLKVRYAAFRNVILSMHKAPRITCPMMPQFHYIPSIALQSI